MPFENQDLSLTLPEGAGPGEARIVIGTELPPPLNTYLYNNVSPVKAALIFFHGLSGNDDFIFLALIEDTAVSPSNLILQLGHVQNGVVVEQSGLFPKGMAWFLNQSSGDVDNLSRADTDTFDNRVLLRGDLVQQPAGLTDPLFHLFNTGEFWWGPGNGTLDVSVRRSFSGGVASLELRHDLWVTGNSFDGTHWAEDATDITVTSNTFTAVGSAIFCGFAFRAPPSGRGTVLINAHGDGDALSGAQLGARIRNGSTVGAGTDFQASNQNYAASVGEAGAADANGAGFVDVRGLTPGNLYNVHLEHQRSQGSGSPRIFHRQLKWLPDIG